MAINEKFLKRIQNNQCPVCEASLADIAKPRKHIDFDEMVVAICAHHPCVAVKLNDC